MSILKIIILMFSMIYFVSSFGQLNPGPTSEQSTRDMKRQRRVLARTQINQLKDGALLIRLQTKRNSITALRKYGNQKLADKIERKQKKHNLKIISAFRVNFNFCPTFFFYSDYSKNIIEGQLDKVIFLSDSLMADSTIKFNKTNFLTAEFGIIERDTLKYFSHQYYEPQSDWNLQKVKKYQGGTNMGFEALLIKSNKLFQLTHPFPFYVRTFNSLPIKRSLKRTVKKMNKRLFKFYKSQMISNKVE